MTDQPANEQFHASSFMEGENAEYLEAMYARYANDPNTVDEAWQTFLRRWAMTPKPHRPRPLAPLGRGPIGPRPPKRGDGRADRRLAQTDRSTGRGRQDQGQSRREGVEVSDAQVKQAVLDSIRALMLIRAYRIRGHLAADLDPLGMRDTGNQPELDPKSYGFTDADMDRPIFIDQVLGLEVATMKQIVDIVRSTYCGTFALQYMHISDPEQAGWLKERIEGYGKEIHFTKEGRKAILSKLVEAEGFEKFLHVKYMGTKRFGLDGGESLVPAMEQIIKRGGQLGVKDIVIGMPHRGRLSVLANVMQSPTGRSLTNSKAAALSLTMWMVRAM